MFNIFKKQDEPDIDIEGYEQALIIQFNLSGENEFGSERERDLILELEDKIELVLSGTGLVDGHEFGDNEALIYLYGKSADSIYTKIETLLYSFEIKPIHVTLRYGAVTDENCEEKLLDIE